MAGEEQDPDQSNWGKGKGKPKGNKGGKNMSSQKENTSLARMMLKERQEQCPRPKTF